MGNLAYGTRVGGIVSLAGRAVDVRTDRPWTLDDERFRARGNKEERTGLQAGPRPRLSSDRIKLPGDELYEINDHTRGTT